MTGRARGGTPQDCEKRYYDYYSAYATYAIANAANTFGENVKPVPEPDRDDFMPYVYVNPHCVS